MAIRKKGNSNDPRNAKHVEQLSEEEYAAIDDKRGFKAYQEGPARTGWLINLREATTEFTDEQLSGEKSGVELYFLDEEGDYFRAHIPFEPYFLIKCASGTSVSVEEYIRHTYGDLVSSISHENKEDLEMPNHLIGYTQPMLKLNFRNNKDMMACRRALKQLVQENNANSKFAQESYDSGMPAKTHSSSAIMDVNEEDVPYTVRVLIDRDIRVGKWYKVIADEGVITIEEQPHLLARPDPVVFAFDIEAAKDPLMFPDPENDQITMISYMVDGRGYLITNRAYVSKDIDPFEFTPKPEYPGFFEIFNEVDERATLKRFFDQIIEERPTVMVSFNGDFFDWPYIEKRATANGLSMLHEIGFRHVGEDVYSSSSCCHLDAFAWVKRDSYLPQGSQNLKDVTKVKLGYAPHELDPEDMTPFAQERPQKLAEYSVSDAVATYYLYMKYVHPFIFSLCVILPLKPDDVLRKGTGTLCEMLLMVQAYQQNILLPHKHADPAIKFHEGHLIESETYSGGHVECLEPGVFRNDLQYDFSLDPNTVQGLIDEVKVAVEYTVKAEMGVDINELANLDDVVTQISDKLADLKNNPVRKETPFIYHLDVASMYPNIMTTNRLQPDSVVTEETCQACHFHRRDKTCARKLKWKWRGEYYNATQGDYNMIVEKLRQETHPLREKLADSKLPVQTVHYDDLPQHRKDAVFKQRVKDYSKAAGSRPKTTEEKEVEAIICQRENPFYINTVRDFKDRRINFKRMQKTWKIKADECENFHDKEEAKKMVVLYDSMQLAHKVILNSFYGYVKRTGSRWYSAEMAGVTCYTGANIIQEASDLVKGLGRPLELDTDGIWCILPGSFPDVFKLQLKNGKSLKLEYPGVILNYMVWKGYTNNQYQTLNRGDDNNNLFHYDVTTENSIFFEVDGPYKAMIIPTSLEQGVNIKKRYAVFDLDGSLSELKGFELKRRGELEIVKKLQSGLFAEFLKGKSLQESYAAAAKRADMWLRILEEQGQQRDECDLLGLISENKSMSKPITEYAGQKSTTITAARRIAEFLGSRMIQRKGLNAKFVIAKYPRGSPVTDRAIPVAIFNAPENTKNTFLRKWLLNPPIQSYDLRDILDWDYYRKRLQVVIQKIITVPAALQNMPNPLPRVEHPPWLEALLKERASKYKQQKLTGFFTKTDKLSHMSAHEKQIADLEDTISDSLVKPRNGVATVSKRKAGRDSTIADDETDQLAVNLNAADAPDIEKDYSAWLMFTKRIWQAQHKRRIERQRLFGNKSVRPSTSAGMKGRLQALTENIFKDGSWKLLQVMPGASSGQVKAQIVVNGRIQSIKINVLRKIYVDFSVDPTGILSELPPDVETQNSDYSLPGNQPNKHLVCLQMPESTYEQLLVHADSILKNPQVTGIFESEITPVDRVILALGSKCELNNTRPGLLGQGLNSGFKLEDLRPLPPKAEDKHKSRTDEPGLASLGLEFIHLQHHEINKQIIAVLSTSWSSDVTVLTYCPSSQTPSSLNFTAGFQEAVRDTHENTPMDSPNFQYETLRDVRRFYAKLSATISSAQAERNTRAVVALESPKAVSLLKVIRSLGDLPTVVVPSPKRIGNVVGWQQTVAMLSAKAMLRVKQKLEKLFALSVFADVPLGNTSSESQFTLIDFIYGRKLLEKRCVLWWTRAPCADYGGNQTEFKLAIDEFKHPSISNPGLYAEVCVDFDISNFAISTILSSSMQSAVDGTDNAMELDSQGQPFLQETLSPVALSELTSLVREWWTALCNGSEVADLFIQKLFAWISDPSSLLFDSRLKYHVENLSTGIFKKMISVLQKFGYRIIMASRTRLVLGSNKAFFESAYSVSQAITNDLKKFSPKLNEHSFLFTYLELRLQQHWDYLIWSNENNYAGRLTSSDITSMDNELVVEHVSEWQVSESLPLILKEEFEEMVMMFMQAIGEKKQAIAEASAQDESSSVEAVKALGFQRENEGETEVPYFATGVINDLSKIIISRVKNLNRKYIECLANTEQDAKNEFSLPDIADNLANQVETHPILALIKDISVVYGVDVNLRKEFLWLRKRLLDILRIGEFETRAQVSKRQSESVLHNVVCPECSYVTDIDICHPPVQRVFDWQCHACLYPLDRIQLEEKLIEKVVGLAARFQVQDFVCQKCKKLRADDLALHCPCSGSFQPQYTHQYVHSTIQLFQHLAAFYDLRFLRDAVDLLSI